MNLDGNGKQGSSLASIDLANHKTESLLSVVMPVYNQEVVLEETLASIAAQTFDGYELLCIDDGSSDCSRDILRAYAASDGHLRLFLRPHEGAAKARNYGLSRAVGKYVIFLDSDDLFHPAFFERMVDALERTDADVCICEYDAFESGDNRVSYAYRFRPKLREGLYDRGDLGRDTFNVGMGVPWNKMYRRSLLLDCGASFQDVRCSDDCLFTAKAIMAARTVFLLEQSLVRYRRGLGTSIEDRRYPFSADILTVVEELFRQIWDDGALGPEEALGLRLGCGLRIARAVDGAMVAGIYTKEFHARVVEDLRETGVDGLPLRDFDSGLVALWVLLLKNATYEGTVWASGRWHPFSAGESYTMLRKVGFAVRVVVAAIAGRLGR